MVLADFVHRGFGDGHMDGWFWFWGWLPMVLFLIAAVALIVVLVRSKRPVDTGDPFRRVAARYAAGEIERVEFERIQRDLRTVEAGRPLDEPGEETGDQSSDG